MSVPPSITIDHVQVAKIEKNSMTLSIEISGESIDQKTVETKALLDTGAGGKFIDQNFIWNQKIKIKNLEHPIEVFNVDGAPNNEERSQNTPGWIWQLTDALNPIIFL